MKQATVGGAGESKKTFGEASAAAARWQALRRGLAEYLGLIAVLAALVIVFGLSTDHFFSLTTFRTIVSSLELRQYDLPQPPRTHAYRDMHPVYG